MCINVPAWSRCGSLTSCFAQDLLIALGVVTGKANIGNGLGFECSGVVTAVGPGVTRHRVGDRVVAASSGAFTTSLRIDERLCFGMPDALTFEDGASMAAVYSTSIYSLMDVAKLSKGMASFRARLRTNRKLTVAYTVGSHPLRRWRSGHRSDSDRKDLRSRGKIAVSQPIQISSLPE